MENLRAGRRTAKPGKRQHLILSPKCWADGGKTVIALAGYNTNTWFDIVRLPQLGPGFPEPVLQTPFSESHPDVSPHGRYLAYVGSSW
jgi:Tol biopolymer transport system component